MPTTTRRRIPAMRPPTQPERHLYSPLGDQRERAVPCRGCLAGTFNVCGRCDRHCNCAPMPAPDPATARTDIPAPHRGV